jgi:hypothetical protein
MAVLNRDSMVSLPLCSALLVAALACFGCKGSSTPPNPAPDSLGTTPEAKPAGPVMGKLDEKNFSVVMQSSGPYKAGEQGNVEVVLEPKGAFHCNQEYPYKMKLAAAPAGVTYPMAVVKTENVTVTPERAVMKVPFVAEKAGEAKLTGNFYFSVCTSEQCVIENRELAVMVKVE